MNFEPWIGTNYADGFRDGLKLLLLGESHFFSCAEGRQYNPARHDLPAFTRPYTTCVVNKYFLPMPVERSSYFGNDIQGRLHRMLTGKDDPNEEDVRQAWSRIAYTNYIQQFVGGKASSPKRAAHWASGKAVLPELLRELAPDRVLVFGKSTWNRLGDDSGQWLSRSWSVDGSEHGLWGLSSQGRLIPTTWIHHPSRPLGGQGMRAVLDALMAWR